MASSADLLVIGGQRHSAAGAPMLSFPASTMLEELYLMVRFCGAALAVLELHSPKS